MWSRKHKKCLMCGTTDDKHYGLGLCHRCYLKDYYKKHPENRYKNIQERRDYVNRIMKKRYRKIKHEIEEVLGTSCIICGSAKKLEKHEKEGNAHDMAIRFYRNNLDDFVLLCYWCHKSVHWMMENMNFSWDEIICCVNGAKRQ